MALIRLIYYSQNQIETGIRTTLQTLSSILSASNRNNKARNITGALIFDDNWFVQILEGEEGSVRETYNRINDDHRHTNVILLEQTEVTSRIFANWWMGAALRTDKSDHIFRAYSRRCKFDPSALSKNEILSMAIELAKVGLHRELAEPAANHKQASRYGQNNIPD